LNQTVADPEIFGHDVEEQEGEEDGEVHAEVGTPEAESAGTGVSRDDYYLLD
jgi:hypothetical protein